LATDSCTSRQTEARGNLKALYVAQESFGCRSSATTIAWRPDAEIGRLIEA
jgi:hypothetical protein